MRNPESNRQSQAYETRGVPDFCPAPDVADRGRRAGHAILAWSNDWESFKIGGSGRCCPDNTRFLPDGRFSKSLRPPIYPRRFQILAETAGAAPATPFLAARFPGVCGYLTIRVVSKISHQECEGRICTSTSECLRCEPEGKADTYIPRHTDCACRVEIGGVARRSFSYGTDRRGLGIY